MSEIKTTLCDWCSADLGSKPGVDPYRLVLEGHPWILPPPPKPGEYRLGDTKHFCGLECLGYWQEHEEMAWRLGIDAEADGLPVRMASIETGGVIIMSEPTTESIVAFLHELTELSRRHGIQIGGCGCCGSPFLAEIDDDKKDGAYSYHGVRKDQSGFGAYVSRFNGPEIEWVADKKASSGG